MCKLLLLMLLFFVSNMFAKEEHAIQQEINQNLWAPFKQAFETLDAPTLNALYAKEVLRVHQEQLILKIILSQTMKNASRIIEIHKQRFS